MHQPSHGAMCASSPNGKGDFMHLYELCLWLQSTSWATGIRESLNLYPALYTLHIFGFVIMVTSTSVLDLCVLGLSLQSRTVSDVARLTLPWAQAGLAANLLTGFFVFAAQPIFHFSAYRSVNRWELGSTPFAAKFAGAFSILLWFGIVAMGRWIAWF
jgi:hypothetical protein